MEHVFARDPFANVKMLNSFDVWPDDSLIYCNTENFSTVHECQAVVYEKKKAMAICFWNSYENEFGSETQYLVGFGCCCAETEFDTFRLFKSLEYLILTNLMAHGANNYFIWVNMIASWSI